MGTRARSRADTDDAGSGWARPHPLGGKAGIVTGGGHGIGKAIALRLGALGANVGINYWQSRDAAEATAREVETLGAEAALLPGDLGSESDVRRIVNEAASRFGSLDFLVNNAGGQGGAATDNAIDTAEFADWNRLLASNLSSAFLATRYAAPLMLRQKSGRIVNISSICGITGDCGPAYCAAKAGLLGLTRHSAVALAPYIQVNAILPGFVDSQAHNTEKVGRITPGRKMGHPDEIADLTGYLLASPQSFLTGACIVMDGSVTNGIIGRMMDWDEAKSLDQR
jgi:3-oxoacyl-[acyl-carrier protein] reductase